MCAHVDAPAASQLIRVARIPTLPSVHKHRVSYSSHTVAGNSLKHQWKLGEYTGKPASDGPASVCVHVRVQVHVHIHIRVHVKHPCNHKT